MNIKNGIVFVGIFAAVCSTVQAELSYMDYARMAPIAVGPNRTDKYSILRFVGSSIKLPIAIRDKNFERAKEFFDDVQPSLLIVIDKAIARPLDLKGRHSLEKVIKYNAWYGRQYKRANGNYKTPLYWCTDGSLSEGGVVSLVEPVVFLGTDYAFSHVVESDVVKKGLECVPKDLRTFAIENGQFVLAAGAARVASAVAVEGRDGLSLDNAARFGKAVAIQVGAHGLEKYVINPAVEKVDPIIAKVTGLEEGTAKPFVSFAANYGALLVINYLTNR